MNNLWGKAPRPLLLFLLGLAGGLLVEALLLMHAHCSRVESMLLEDFRVLAFVEGRPEDSRVRVIEEKLRGLAGVEALRYVSPEESLAEVQARDPELTRSVAVLGENPLSGVLEIQLSPGHVIRLPHWLREAESIPGLGDIRYKPAQARAILQVQFYQRFLTLTLSLAGCLWLLAGARFLWTLGDPERARPGPEAGRELGARAGSAALGTGMGMAAACLFAYPSASLEMLNAWPPAGLQVCLLFAGTLAGAMLSYHAQSPSRRGLHRDRERHESGEAARLAS